MKDISRKNIIMLVLLVIVGIIFLSITLFYFLPIPEAVKNVTRQSKIERCIYSGGIGYKAIFQLESFSGGIFSTIIYNSHGEQICSSGGYSGKPLEELCKAAVCFSLNDK